MYSASERAAAEVEIDVDATATRLRFVQRDKFAPFGMWTFIWHTDGKLYMANATEQDKHEIARVGHSSFFGGRPLLFAGELMTNSRGDIRWISDASGHYKPTPEYYGAFYRFMRDDKGVDATTIEWRKCHEKFLSRNKVLTPAYFELLEVNDTSKRHRPSTLLAAKEKDSSQAGFQT